MVIVDLSNNELKLLRALKKSSLSPGEASLESGLGDKEVMSAASWLRSKGLVEIIEDSKTLFSTNDEGKKYAEQGLPERRAAEWLNQSGEAQINELPLDDDEKKVVIGWLKRKNFAELEKTDDGLKLIPTGNLDETPDEPLLVLLDRKPLTEEEMDKEGLSLLKGRQLLKNHDEVSRLSLIHI